MDASILSLYELNQAIRNSIAYEFSDLYWIRAETSDVRENQNGHCYLEFIQKDEKNKNVIAKVRGAIWANTFQLLKLYFQTETGQAFASGMKVLVQVSVEFHEVYGLSLNVRNIDPNYTLGDQARNRAEIIRRLEEEGVLEMNKELRFPELTNRIAIISSPSAAGYEDFCNQLNNNKQSYIFYTHLFPAIMQGDRTEESILSALDRIYENINSFDTVVIIRGGGATSELSSFDSYLLATSCAQFPLPIITGIGHERDDTVLDIVAHTRAKTPTAVAEFLINKVQETENDLFAIQDNIIQSVSNILQYESLKLNTLSTHFSYLLKERTKDQLSRLIQISYKIKSATIHLIKNEQYRLEGKEQHLKLASPENILKKGYTLTLKGNKIVKNSTDLNKDDEIATLFKDGKIFSIVK